MAQARLNDAERIFLIGMRFTHVVFVKKDVSVEVPGSVQSAFRKKADAEKEAARLSSLYAPADGFAVEAL
jgi:hypothetical protein